MAVIKKAPVKLNLFLHVTGKRNDGYHNLQSLIAFGDFGDVLSIKHSNKFSFKITGLFANNIQTTDDNLIIRAIKEYKGENTPLPNLEISLEKNIPIGAGLGGGSSDAAAMIHALEELEIPIRTDKSLDDILLSLGADVPVCYYTKSCFVEGIGEKITEAVLPSKIPALLINPNVPCATPDIFAKIKAPYTKAISTPNGIISTADFVLFLKDKKNDLTDMAINTVPEIKNIFYILNKQDGCQITRMSGSGSTCFSLFGNAEEMQQAKDNILQQHPNWWIQDILLN